MINNHKTYAIDMLYERASKMPALSYNYIMPRSRTPHLPDHHLH